MNATYDQLVGTELRPLRRGPWTSSHIARWCAAQQNWDKIHYDLAYATQVARLPGTIINGALKQHLIVQFLESAVPNCRVWRIDYRFAAMDFVGQSLELCGEITGQHPLGSSVLLMVNFAIRNVEQDKITTTGTGVLVAGLEDRPDRPIDDSRFPDELRLDNSVRPLDAAMPASVIEKLGTVLEEVASDYPIDLSRLRLFCEAVGEMSPIYFDPASSVARQVGGVLAPPLFPLHALESRPGRRVLSADPRAMGREGSNEVGRHIAGYFGFEIAWNGGNRVQIHSLARAGERVAARSVLVGAFARSGKVGGEMLFFETLNRYITETGRDLLSERQMMICRAPFRGDS